MVLKTSLTLLALVIRGQVHSQAKYITETSKVQKKLTEQDIERIIVTGSRIAEKIDEVPASITIITQKQIVLQLKVSSEIQSLLANLVIGMAPSKGTSSNTISLALNYLYVGDRKRFEPVDGKYVGEQGLLIAIK